MKRIVVALCIVAFASLALVAQEAASARKNSSDYYPVRLDVVKVYSHADGFRVVYRKGMAGFADLYLPLDWFKPGGSQLVRGEGPAYPYMVVYFKEGKFSHVRLYVAADPRDQSWGMLGSEEGKGKFEVTELKLEF